MKMKKYQLFKKVVIVFSVPLLLAACDDDDAETSSTVDFGTIASTAQESDAATVTIPLRNAGDLNNLQVAFGGSAIEGEDYEFVGITGEGVQVKILEDADLEPVEDIRVQLVPKNGSISGNAFHSIRIVSNCEDVENPYIEYFKGDFLATEQYGSDPANWWGPYHVEFEQDEEDPNMFHMHNFYDAGREAYVVFNLAEGTVFFPDQTPLPDTSPNLLSGSTGTFTIDDCNGSFLTITLDYDGGEWVYSFVKQ
jgi:hypothetical protein